MKTINPSVRFTVLVKELRDLQRKITLGEPALVGDALTRAADEIEALLDDTRATDGIERSTFTRFTSDNGPGEDGEIREHPQGSYSWACDTQRLVDFARWIATCDYTQIDMTVAGNRARAVLAEVENSQE